MESIRNPLPKPPKYMDADYRTLPDIESNPLFYDEDAQEIEDFSQKYRYADEAEEVKLGKFISKLDFAQPGQLSIQEVYPYPHENVYLCFLMGTEALFQIFIFGKYDDILRDYDEWEVFSPCLLLVDEDFIHYAYVNDDGEVMESQVS